MLRTPLVALMLFAASGASAQIAEECRGETLSELERCLAAQSAPPEPAPVEPEEELAPDLAVPGPGAAPAITPGLAQRRVFGPIPMGGPLRPTDLRAPPPRIAGPSANAPATVAPRPRAPAAPGSPRMGSYGQR